MAVAQLSAEKLFQFRLVLRQSGLTQCFDGLLDRRLVGGFSAGWRIPQESRCAERERAGGSQVTTGQLHGFLPWRRSFRSVPPHLSALGVSSQPVREGVIR